MSRILLAVVKEGNLANRAISRKDVLIAHDIVVVDTWTEARRSLESEQFDLVVCDVGFDQSQLFDVWEAVRRKEPQVAFLAYRELDSDLGESMEQLVAKTLSGMGLASYLDLREFTAPYDCKAFVEFIELGLQPGSLKEGMLNDSLLSSLGKAVENRRLKLGISLEALSQASGLKLKLLKNLEKGKQVDLELSELWKLAAALDIIASKLIKEAEGEG